MKEYKVAFIFTDEYHTPVEGKSYQIGSKEPISATSKPIILYFWMDDYVREWDKGSPKLYEDQHGSVIESLKWDGKNLNLNILDYATFSQEEYNFSVGSECITPDNIVQENDYTSPYLITPTKIIVTDKIMDIVKEPLGIALREKLEGVWKGADKFTKVAENENFSAEYNACSSCNDSVLGLAAESSCSECAEESFNAETFEEEDHYYDLIWDIPPRHRGEDYDAYYKHIENKSMSFEDIKDYLIKNKNKITPKLDKSPSNESNECSQCSEVIATYCPQCHESYCKDCYEEYRHWFDIRLKGQSGYGDEKSEIILKDVCWDNFEYGIFNNSPLSKGE